MKKMIESVDHKIVGWFRVLYHPFARISLFIVFFWFGILKVLNVSPATPLVRELFSSTFLAPLPFHAFLVAFGFFEMLIGILFLIPRFERVAIAFLAFHMITTAMPLFILTDVTWKGFLTPTLEGQYIIKNLIIIGLALSIVATRMKSFREARTKQSLQKIT